MNISRFTRACLSATPSLAFVGLVLAAAAAADSASAQSSAARTAMLNPVIYPAREQSPKQQEQDKFECYGWAKQQSGFDPAQATSAAPAAPAPANPSNPSTASANGGATGSMVRGAAGGAAVAELAHKDAGHGAAVGVLGSAVMQRVKSQQAAQANSSTQQQQLQQQQQQMAEQMAAREQQRTNYARAFGACMEARGYVLK